MPYRGSGEQESEINTVFIFKCFQVYFWNSVLPAFGSSQTKDPGNNDYSNYKHTTCLILADKLCQGGSVCYWSLSFSGIMQKRVVDMSQGKSWAQSVCDFLPPASAEVRTRAPFSIYSLFHCKPSEYTDKYALKKATRCPFSGPDESSSLLIPHPRNRHIRSVP